MHKISSISKVVGRSFVAASISSEMLSILNALLVVSVIKIIDLKLVCSYSTAKVVEALCYIAGWKDLLESMRDILDREPLRNSAILIIIIITDSDTMKQCIY